jgi:hypothetical protein
MRFSTRVIAIAALAIGNFLCTWASSQVVGGFKASSGGGATGTFTSPSEASGGNLTLGLKLVFALEKKVSPGMTYAVLERLNGAHFAYYCIVLHKYSGEVPGEFPFECHVEDDGGKIEQSLKIGTLNCKIAYSIIADSKSTSKDKETFTIQGTDVDLSKGRLLIVDMTGDAVVIKQAAIPPAITSKFSAKKSNETANRVLSDVSQALNNGKLKARVLKMN